MKTGLSILFIFFFTLFGLTAYAQYEDDSYYDKPEKRRVRNRTEAKQTEGTEEGVEDKTGGFDKSKLSIGGIFGATFGDVIYIDLSPIVAYRFTDHIQSGVGFIYQYYNYRGYPEPYNQASLFGGRVFNRVFVWDQLYLHLEYLIQNGEVYYYDQIAARVVESRGTFNTVFVGGGYNVPIGQNSFMSVQLLVNVNTNYAYPKRLPLFSVGFGIGL